MAKFKITESRGRLDHYLTPKLDLSRSKIQALIKSDHILVNSSPVKASYLLEPGDLISVDLPPAIEHPVIPWQEQFRPIHEDPHLLILEKHSGVTVHPAGPESGPTLVDGLKAYGCPLSQLAGPLRPGIVHHLDKETEGLMVIAKTDAVHAHLKTQFKDRQVIKRYRAMVRGDIEDDEQTLTLPIARHPNKRQLFHVKQDNPDAKEAITTVKVLKRYGGKTLVELHPKTGRTHQLRVHLAHIGHPILGDPLYNKQRPSRKRYPDGQLLQAYFLSFVHPVNGMLYGVSLPWAEWVPPQNKVVI